MWLRWLWIILGVIAVFWLIGRIRVGAHIALQANSPTVRVKIGPFGIRVFPAKKTDKPPKEKKTKKKKAAKGVDKQKKDGASGEKKKPKITLEDIRSAIDALWPPLKRALGRTHRSIRIRPLDLSVTVGGAKDPASAAEGYGYIHMGVWTGMPVLEQLLVIPDPHIHIGIDFDEASTRADGEAGISIRIGTIFAVAFGIGIPAVMWYLNFTKKQKQQAQTPANGEEQPTKPAA